MFKAVVSLLKICKCSHCIGKRYYEFVNTKIYKKVEENKQTKQVSVSVIIYRNVY